MTSTRLPGKILKQVLGKSLLAYQIERLKRAKFVDGIVIATTTNKEDDVLVAFCQAHDIDFVRGSEPDVLGRYALAAKKFQADVVVRVTSDCPLIDPEVMDRVISTYLRLADKLDYASNCLIRTYPRGLDTEVFSSQVLQELDHTVMAQNEREHVTLNIIRHPEKYRCLSVECEEGDFSAHRWTVDTAEDFELIRCILEELYPRNPNFSFQDVLTLLKLHPDWQKINAHIEQKHYS